MRNQVSLVVLLTQPAFMLAPAAILGTAALGLGMPWATILIAVNVAGESVGAVRAIQRQRAATAALEEPPSHPVLLHRGEHPALWALIDDLAAQAGIPAPERIVLTLTTPAGVGLLPPEQRPAQAPRRAYELLLDPAVIADLSQGQLSAVVAHELGHVATGAMRELDPAHRLATSFSEPLYEALPPSLLKLGGWVHRQLWLAVDAWASRPNELLADSIAFRVAGPATTAAALARVEKVMVAEAVVAAEYFAYPIRAGLRPSILEAVRGVLAVPGGLVDRYVPPRPRGLAWALASHPTIPQRIAAAERAVRAGLSAGADARSAADPTPAISLVDGGLAWLMSREAGLYADAHPLHDAPAAEWAAALDAGWRLVAADQAQQLVDVITTAADGRGRRLPHDGPVPPPVQVPADLVTARDYLDAAARLGVGVTQHDQDLSPARQHATLTLVAQRALDRAGLLRLRQTGWQQPPLPEYRAGSAWLPLRAAAEDGGFEAEDATSPLDVVLDEVAADRAPVTDLVTLLEILGADLDSPLGLNPAERADRPAEFLAAHPGVTVSEDGVPLDGIWCAVVLTTGLWLVPEQPVGAGRSAERDRAEQQMVERLAREVDFARAPRLDLHPGSRWLPETLTAEVRLAEIHATQVHVVDLEARTLTLRLPDAVPTLGVPVPAALARSVGSRLLVG